MELTSAHPLQVFANFINILPGKISTIIINTGPLFVVGWSRSKHRED